ncbi:MAG: hypothetical protein GXP62_18175 [Oligoflexia bacterium]|nr:hypothetical protein [Oligoflexia bacterium]
MQGKASSPSPTSDNPVIDALNQIERCSHLESCTDLGAESAEVEFDSWLRSQ